MAAGAVDQLGFWQGGAGYVLKKTDLLKRDGKVGNSVTTALYPENYSIFSTGETIAGDEQAQESATPVRPLSDQIDAGISIPGIQKIRG